MSKACIRAFLLIALCHATAAQPALSPELTILVEDAAGPWSNADGTGMANDLVKAAYAAVGVQVRLSVVPYARCKALVIKGLAPACFSMSASPEFKQSVQLADKPLFLVYPRYYRRAGNPGDLLDDTSMRRGARLGIVNGYEYPADVARLAERGVVLEAARSDVINLKKLASGRIDVALIMTDDLKNDAMLIRQAQVSGLAFAFQNAPMGSFIGFSTIHPQGAEAQRLFNLGYQRIARDGSKQRIEEKWRRLCVAGCDA